MSKQLRLNPKVFSQKVGEDLILLDLESGTYFELNETGRLIVQGIEKDLTKSDIIELITSSFNVEAAMAEADFHGLCSELLKHGLVEQVP